MTLENFGSMVGLKVSGEITPAPVKTERFGKHYEVTIACGDDATASLTFGEDAYEWLKKKGLIAPEKE